MSPKQCLGSCQKIFSSSKRTTRLHSSRLQSGFSLLPESQRREREFVVDMVSEKDLKSAELATMRTSRSPTTVMTANGERTKNEATKMSNNWTYSSILCFFKKLPQYFRWKKNSARNMGARITGKAVRIHTHISSRMARELIAIYQTMYHSWFLFYQRLLPQLRLHLPRHHLHHRSQHRKTVIQY